MINEIKNVSIEIPNLKIYFFKSSDIEWNYDYHSNIEDLHQCNLDDFFIKNEELSQTKKIAILQYGGWEIEIYNQYTDESELSFVSSELNIDIKDWDTYKSSPLVNKYKFTILFFDNKDISNDTIIDIARRYYINYIDYNNDNINEQTYRNDILNISLDTSELVIIKPITFDINKKRLINCI